uniref:Uncharacterized protein n=1 Tax=Spongospora subterranea TaxID=70186 RepID=A0A0H5REN4_9EUKA|eukprot:CRZ12685.1 hypothetical protein [Spongospora subterranea]
MPRLSERGQLLGDIERLIRYMAVGLSSAQLLRPTLASQLKQQIDALMSLKFGILCYRNLNPRRWILKDYYLWDILPFLEDQEFVQDLRCSRETFQAIFDIIKGHRILPVFWF